MVVFEFFLGGSVSSRLSQMLASRVLKSALSITSDLKTILLDTFSDKKIGALKPIIRFILLCSSIFLESSSFLEKTFSSYKILLGWYARHAILNAFLIKLSYPVQDMQPFYSSTVCPDGYSSASSSKCSLPFDIP